MEGRDFGCAGWSSCCPNRGPCFRSQKADTRNSRCFLVRQVGVGLSATCVSLLTSIATASVLLAKESMTAAGKPIYHLGAKITALAEILCDAGQGLIEGRKASHVAKAIRVKEKSLQTAITSQRLSRLMEAAICQLGMFEASQAAWCDPALSDEDRRKLMDDPSQSYTHGDTADAFREMLRRKWNVGTKQFRAISERATSVDSDVACHEFSSPQTTEAGMEMPLLFEADFGTIYNSNGLKYGFAAARLKISIQGSYRASTRARFAHGTEQSLGKASFVGRGISSSPAWDISTTSDSGILEGNVRTTDDALFMLVDHSANTRIETSLTLNINDARLIQGDDAAQPLSPNKRVIIEAICAMEFAKDRDAYGNIEVSRHDLQIEEVKR
jgi:hypothetical protein